MNPRLTKIFHQIQAKQSISTADADWLLSIAMIATNLTITTIGSDMDMRVRLNLIALLECTNPGGTSTTFATGGTD